MKMDPTIVAALITLLGIIIMGAFSMYVSNQSLNTIKEYLKETLPGLFAIEFNKWQLHFARQFASVERVESLERQINELSTSHARLAEQHNQHRQHSERKDD